MGRAEEKSRFCASEEFIEMGCNEGFSTCGSGGTWKGTPEGEAQSDFARLPFFILRKGTLSPGRNAEKLLALREYAIQICFMSSVWISSTGGKVEGAADRHSKNVNEFPGVSGVGSVKLFPERWGIVA